MSIGALHVARTGLDAQGFRMQVIANLEGGIVSEILVKAGDQVKKGQPLLRLDRTLAGAELGSG